MRRPGLSLQSRFYAAILVLLAIVVLVMIVLPVVVETASGGRSLGRLAIGARIVRWDGGASGLRQAMVRALVGVFEIWLTLGSVALLTGVFIDTAARKACAFPLPFRERMEQFKITYDLPWQDK